ncbi:MAG: hypothetical protein JST20_11965 [Bacteroidetes bacterium]|nr:hypothetical protein [Bacteroidota bacterium]
MKPKDANSIAWGVMCYGICALGVGIFSNDRESQGVLIFMGIFCCAGGIARIIYLRQKQEKSTQDAMNSIFYELVKKTNGRITVLDFAIESNTNPSEARSFIEQKSIQLVATTEIDDSGSIIYIFK